MTASLSLAAANKTGITNAAPLSTAPSYGGGNPPVATGAAGRRPRWLLVEVDATGAGTGTIAVTLWYAEPSSQRVSIADDRGLSGVWTVSYAAAALTRSRMFEWPACDIGFTATVSAINITANIRTTAIYGD